MRHILMLLTVVVSLTWSMSVSADMADCDGSSTPQGAENREKLEFVDAYGVGTTPIHSAALGLMNICGAMKRLDAALLGLGASPSSPPTDAQVDEALNAASVSEPKRDDPQVRTPMSKNVAIIERNRVADMDAKAESLVQSNCGGFGCSSLLDDTVSPVIREVEKINADPEYLAHLPKYGPIVSVETAARFGWARENGFWVNNGAQQRQATPSGSTLGNYLLSLGECKKLRDRLEQEIKASPAQELVELSLFEAECLPQVTSYAEDVKGWRALLLIRAEVKKPVVVIVDNASSTDHREPAVDVALEQWNEGIVGEERQHDAEMALAAETMQRAEDKKKKAEAQKVSQQKLAMAEAESKAAREGWVLPSDCQAEQAAIRQNQDDDRTGRNTEQSIAAALQQPWEYRWSGKKTGELITVEELIEKAKDTEKELKEREAAVARCRAATGYAAMGCIGYTELGGNYRLGQLRACVYRAAAARRSGLPPASFPGKVESSSVDTACEVKLKAIDNQVDAALPRCGESATCNLQASMWGLSQQISAIENYCPNGNFAAKLPDAKNQLESLTTTCNQILSGGGRCSPKL